jgi:hypothetical protein
MPMILSAAMTEGTRRIYGTNSIYPRYSVPLLFPSLEGVLRHDATPEKPPGIVAPHLLIRLMMEPICVREPTMARISAVNSDGALASRASAAPFRGVESRPFRYVPGFLYILVLFIVGKLIFPDPRATLVQWGEYHLSWVEILMVGAAMMAMAEQLRVSHPGIDNTIEAILMAAVAGVQVLLFALGAAGVKDLRIFNNTEFIMLTLISMMQAIVAILINARTLRRTIGVGDNT